MSEFRVLLAGDSATVREMIAYALSAAGYRVEAAGDGLDAVRTALYAAPDLVLMDAQLPRVDGLVACRLLKTEPASRDIPVIIRASRDSGLERLHAAQAGADRFLDHETTAEDIARAIRGCLAGRSPRPAAREGEAAEPPGDAEILLRLSRILDRKLFVATLFNEIGGVGRDVDDFESTVRAMNGILLELIPHDAMAAVFSDGATLESVLVFPFGAGERMRRTVADQTEMLRLDAAVPVAPNRAMAVEFAFGRARPGSAPLEDLVRPTVVFPIRAGETVRGLLALFAAAGGKPPDDGHLTENLLRHSHMVLENAWLYRQISRLSVTDGLTGLYNRRQFVEVLKREHARGLRYKLPFSLLMVDIDHFKKINDVYGHPAGDTVLRELAAVLSSVMRTTDTVARYGGEEFVALLPETAINEAVQAGERLRLAVERNVFAAPTPLIRCTVSVGVASFRPDAPLADRELLSCADEALYSAKREGRNRVHGR